MSLKYSEFYQQIKDKTKDALDGAGPKKASALIGKFTLAGLRTIQTLFPESRMDINGRMAALPTVGYDQTTGAEVDLPVAAEYEPMLEAYVLRAIYGSDAEDVKDESLFLFWDKRWRELTGEA